MLIERTASFKFTFDAPAGIDLAHLPMVIDFDETWYIKPEVGQFLASPADVPSTPDSSTTCRSRTPAVPSC